MKSCYAAALALVGWYLMIPPQTGGTYHLNDKQWNPPVYSYPTCDLRLNLSELTFDQSAPFSNWITVCAYDTVRECKAHRRDPEECVATDDPRLAK
jgi:hypothetical protein